MASASGNLSPKHHYVRTTHLNTETTTNTSDQVTTVTGFCHELSSKWFEREKSIGVVFSSAGTSTGIAASTSSDEISALTLLTATGSQKPGRTRPPLTLATRPQQNNGQQPNKPSQTHYSVASNPNPPQCRTTHSGSRRSPAAKRMTEKTTVPLLPCNLGKQTVVQRTSLFQADNRLGVYWLRVLQPKYQPCAQDKNTCAPAAFEASVS